MTGIKRAGALAGVCLAGLAVLGPGRPLCDLIAYWSAGRVYLHGGNPYDPAHLLPVQQALGWTRPAPLMVWQPPWILALSAVLGAAPFGAARLAWLGLNLAWLLISAEALWTFYGGKPSRRWWAWLAALTFMPAVLALEMGQMSLLVLVGLVGFVWAADRKRDGLAGLALLLIAVKPHVPYLFLAAAAFWTVWERRWKIWAIAGGGLLALSAAVLLSNPAVQWSAMVHTGGPLAWPQVTLSYGLRLLLGHPAWQFAPTLVGVGGLLVWWGYRAEALAWKRHLSPLLLVSTVTLCFGWLFDLAMLLPVLIEVAVHISGEPSGRWRWGLLGGLAVIQAALVIQDSLHANYLAVAWLPIALGGVYGASRIRRVCSPARLGEVK